MGMGKGSKEVLYKEALAQFQNPIYFTCVLTGKISLSLDIDVAWPH